MDISGPVRTLLQQYLSVPEENPHDPLMLFAQVGAWPSFVPLQMPVYIEAGLSAETDRFLLAAMLRKVPRMGRGIRDPVAKALQGRSGKLAEESQGHLISRKFKPADILWQYWLMVLARRRLKMSVPEVLLKALWQRAFSGQSDGRLHQGFGLSEAEAALGDLRALHAACNVVVFTQDFDLFPPVQKLSDALAGVAAELFPGEPWGLAAFASLDGTGKIAPRMIEKISATPGVPSPMVLALLADAVLSQEDIANV